MGSEELYQRLGSYYQLFGGNAGLYDELFRLIREKEKHENYLKSKIVKAAYVAGGVILGQIFAVIGVMLIIFTMPSSPSQLIPGLVFGAIGFLIPIAIMKLAMDDHRKKIQKIDEKISGTGGVGTRIVELYRSIDSPLIPFEYSDPYTLHDLMEIARLGRAHSVSEAIWRHQEDMKMNAAVAAKEQELKDAQARALALRAAFVLAANTPRTVYVRTR